MARIAFILLCHKNPRDVLAQAAQLTAAGDYVAIHLDGRAPRSDFDTIAAGVRDNPAIALVQNRVRCGWGEWSLVAATLRTLARALDAFADATHFYLLSGDCMPVKSAAYAHEFLDTQNRDYIESVDFHTGGWIKTGFREERLIYRHHFNERTQKRRFYAALRAQQALRLTRAVPADLTVMIGSQWWCLRRGTVTAVLDFIRARPDIMRFFRTTWIPDETFFQTLVRHLVPGRDIESRPLTFLLFTDYGMPVTFYNDHADLLLRQNALFARKISPAALALRARLGALYASGQREFDIAGDGPPLFAFLTARGRVGRRYAPRFWDAETSLGAGRELLVVICKKWHVAKRLAAACGAGMGMATHGYLFDEADAGLPDLGGLADRVATRRQHPRALLRMLYDAARTDRLLICIDPANRDIIADLYADVAAVRLLHVDCTFDDAYLTGHAQRLGVAGAHPAPAVLAALRRDLAHERDAVSARDFAALTHLRQTADDAANTAAIAQFLRSDSKTAQAIAQHPDLFTD